MSRVDRDGVSIYYEYDPGEADADGRTARRSASSAVVFLQGVGAGRWLWRWQRESLRDGHDVIAPDTRGTGRSEPGLPPVVPRLPGGLRTPLLRRFGGYSVDGLAADLDAVLEDAGVTEAHLVGVDLGGMVAQQYAIEYRRAASLTLCGTSHGGPDAVAITEDAREEFFAPRRATADRERIRDRLRWTFSERFVNRNPHLLDRIVEWSLDGDADELARVAQVAAFDGFDASGDLDRIRVPTVVVHGSDDRVVPVENGRLLAVKIPDARLVEIDSGSHYAMIENAGTVTEVLEGYLQDPGAFCASGGNRVGESRQPSVRRTPSSRQPGATRRRLHGR